MLPAIKTRKSRLTPLTGAVKQMALGTLLGDATLVRDRGTKHPRLRMNHGSKQAAYCRHKAEILKDYVRTPPKIVPNGGWGDETCCFATVTSPVFEYLDSLCYRFNESGRRIKTVTKAWADELDERAIAYWFMDDGTMQKRGVVILATHSFSEPEVRLLSKRLGEFGIPSIAEIVRKKERERTYWTIRLRCEPTRRFVEMVRPHIYPTMEYKLRLPPIAAPRICINCGREIPGGRRQNATFVSCNLPVCVKTKVRRRQAYNYQRRRLRALVSSV